MTDPYCAQADCDPRTGCIFGELNPNKCKHRTVNPGGDTTMPVVEGRIPWHGGVLGLAELQFVAARGRPRLIGIIDPHNVGEALFLPSLYIHVLHGMQVPFKLFAGSFTLRAWEALINSPRPRYPTEGKPIFPRHTPMTQERFPGLFHLAFRNEKKRLEDIVFTDAPGEWFLNWAANCSAENAAGARWIIENSDEFLFFIGTEEFAGGNRDVARNLISMFARRLWQLQLDRMVKVIWWNADSEKKIREQCTERITGFLPDAEHFVLTENGNVLYSVMKEILTQKKQRTPTLNYLVDSDTTDPFLKYHWGLRK